MWPHGNITLFGSETILHNSFNKSKNIYFNFNIDTNRSKRSVCFENLCCKLEWLNNVSPQENIMRLSEYKFCICPEGNGVDTHRLWEALYVKTVPIVVNSVFANVLLRNNIPVIILHSWSDLDETKLNYNEFDFNNSEFLKIVDFDYYNNLWLMTEC